MDVLLFQHCHVGRWIDHKRLAFPRRDFGHPPFIQDQTSDELYLAVRPIQSASRCLSHQSEGFSQNRIPIFTTCQPLSRLRSFISKLGVAQVTGMTNGRLQHHLKELALSNLLKRTSERNHYELSEHGQALLLLFCHVARWEPAVEGEEYLVAETIDTGTP